MGRCLRRNPRQDLLMESRIAVAGFAGSISRALRLKGGWSTRKLSIHRGTDFFPITDV